MTEEHLAPACLHLLGYLRVVDCPAMKIEPAQSDDAPPIGAVMVVDAGPIVEAGQPVVRAYTSAFDAVQRWLEAGADPTKVAYVLDRLRYAPTIRGSGPVEDDDGG